MALWMGETANFPGQFTAQIPKCTNSRTFYGRERPVSNSRTFPVFPVVWEPWSSQDRFKHQIWNSYLKDYRRYAPDSMQFLEIKSEVKFKVTVTQSWYGTLCHPKMRPHTKFEISTSNNIRDMLPTRLL